jgi:hypothetical protein
VIVMKKILTALIAATIFSAMALAMSDTADARWGYGGYRGVGYRGFVYRGYGYRGVGYRGFVSRGYGYRGVGYRGFVSRGYGYRGLGYGYGGYGYGGGYAGYGGYPGYGVGTAIVVAPTFYYPVYYSGFSGCGC